ncbi:hypothetical protein EXE58_11320 [Nocardioides seonyuensis]|uniref:ARB-07466-like C-terminal domain-containing protein n=1 Tax=Nocardioides seonyuensis TaxID=2518371 RepID=A0A4P7IH45_9ACTN|nr:hypothetical protein [Nocardioides seonyuensis]QBX55993.1 hypothetical protein EXE58_11320 [Nocardioides seonyuensis]
MGRLVRRGVGVALMLVVSLVATPGTVAAKDAVPDARKATIVTSSAPYVLLPMEDYSGYQPQTRCRRRAKTGVLVLADWLVARGGGYGPISRSCSGSSTSEHKESRAFDWLLDANDPAQAAVAQAFLDEILAPDDTGQPHALARRMGIMYVIWDDRMWASYDGFEEERYLSSGCRSRRRCSPTLRHRDHVHISLSRKGAKGMTSWYAAQGLVVPVAG